MRDWKRPIRHLACLAFLGVSLPAAVSGAVFAESVAQSASGRTFQAQSFLSYRFADGTVLKVHYHPETLSRHGESVLFARDVLDAAVLAYQTIVEEQGFSDDTYTFAHPDRTYAYDPDRTLDILIGAPDEIVESAGLDAGGASFRDAPCFDTIRRGEAAFDAVILIPAHYRQFIRSWEKVNPSSLGKRQIELDLRGTLVHEMLHAILFYYNKNLQSFPAEAPSAGTAPAKSALKVDWYVEGLARYFETLVGAKHDFYSQGFKQTLPGKVRFSRGGSNYYMRYPDQPFTELRYENALFWRYVHDRYGMESVRKLSRDLREPTPALFERLENSIQAPLRQLVRDFAVAAATNDFGLKEESHYLLEIARTELRYRDDSFHLVDGAGQERRLGSVCETDWIGRWHNQEAHFGEPGAGGDATDESDVSPWATDFIQVRFEEVRILPTLFVRHRGGEGPLAAEALVFTRGGSVLRLSSPEVGEGKEARFSLNRELARHGLGAPDVDRVLLLVTGYGLKGPVRYSLEARHTT